MQNYKVEVQNHSEVTEAQDLFLKMGFRKELFSYSGYPKLVITDIDSIGGYSSGAEIGYLDADKITLQELRAMVAPKQKEYLVKTDTGYVLQVLSDVVDGHDGIIEVPEGADTLAGDDNCNYFWKHSDSGKHEIIGCGESLSRYPTWGSCEDSTKEWLSYFKDQHDMRIIWQRKESLNDQVASAEKARQEQAQVREISECDLIDSGKLIIGGLGESFPVGLEHHKFIQPEGFSEGGFIPKQNHGAPVGLLHHGFSGFTQPEELPFISDTQATLSERQSTYGDFKDVSGMTQELLAVMERFGYRDMPKLHKEALHMICSKMARIVNGDHNHLDSWHDICGYAKLIENNIK